MICHQITEPGKIVCETACRHWHLLLRAMAPSPFLRKILDLRLVSTSFYFVDFSNCLSKRIRSFHHFRVFLNVLRTNTIPSPSTCFSLCPNSGHFYPEVESPVIKKKSNFGYSYICKSGKLPNQSA